MAHCPKCNRKFRLFDLSQFCPNCKTNIRFYNFEENFYREAKLAELSQAGMSCKLKRIKAAFFGSRLTLARLFVMLLPALSFLIPTVSYSLNLPFSTTKFDLSILGIVNLFTGGGLDYINSMTNSVLGEQFSQLKTLIIIYLVPIVFAVFILLASILCFLSIKNMQKINCVFSVCGILGSIASIVALLVLKPYANTQVLGFKNGFGLYISIIMFIAVFVVNFLLVKKGINVEYAEGMEERVRIYKEYKAGRVSLDSLSQPVVETAETRAIEEKIAKQEEELFMNGGIDND